MMSVLSEIPISLSVPSVALVTYILYVFLLHPLFVSPLRKIPAAHPLAAVSSVWINWQRHQAKENASIEAAHRRVGPIVKLGPNEISVNCVEGGIKTIYAGGFDKDVWYHTSFWNYGVANMFSTVYSKPHSVRKRMISNIFSKSVLQSSRSMEAASKHIIYTRLLPQLNTIAGEGTSLDLYFLLNCTTMDVVTAYQFGVAGGANFLENEAEARRWLYLYHCRRAYTFWPSEHPRFTAFCKSIGINLAPAFVADANHELEEWTLRRIDAAEAYMTKFAGGDDESMDTPTVYQQLRSALLAERDKPTPFALSPPETPLRLQLASEFLDHLAAGHETSAITLTYLFHEIGRRPALQEALRLEFLGLDSRVLATNKTQELPTAKSIDALPLLHAVIMETLRRHAAIPGPQPRTTPPDTTIGTYSGIPAGVRVSAQAWSLHRDEDVFPQAEEWMPERWILKDQPGIPYADTSKGRHARPTEDQLREMHRWFWAFGSGGRMCIGSNLAIQQMKLIVAAISTGYKVEIVDDEGIEQEDAYTAQPKGGKLIVKLLPW